MGHEPDWVFTHVTRLVGSKGLWRDLQVLEELDRELGRRRQRAVHLVLATEVGARPTGEVWRMATEYGWPLVHREGLPDLTASELQFDLLVRRFNTRAGAVRALFVNQFGFDRASCGPAVPPDITFRDLRWGSDAEFGLSTYEPFGIAALEPLSAGALSVVSDVCGCLGFARRAGGAGESGAVVVGGYAQAAAALDPRRVRDLGLSERGRIESQVSAQVAADLVGRLPSGAPARRRLLARGAEVARAMSWETVAADMLLPALGLS
jgi:hypothetical protein